MKELPAAALTLASTQSGMLSRAQLRQFGWDRHRIQTRLSAGYWAEITSRVISIGASTHSRQQQLWVPLLHYPDVMLTGQAAFESHGLQAEVDSRIDLVTTRYIRSHPCSYWHVHGREVVHPDINHWRRLNWSAATVDSMRFARSQKQATFFAIWALQRRLVTLDSLHSELQRTSRIAGSAAVAAALESLEPGIEAMSELQFLKLCRRYRLPEPTRQVPRVDSAGKRRYLDVLWNINGRQVAVEIDGLGHLDFGVRSDDMFRDNSMAIAGIVPIRIPAHALRTEPDRWMRQIRDALQLAA